MLPTGDLFVYVYVLIHDLMAAGHIKVPPRPGPSPACSDAEPLAIAQVRHLLGTSVPWDQSGTLAVLAGLTSGDGVDRRTFIAASGAAMAVLATRWRSALASSSQLLPGTGSRQVGQELVSHIGERLDYLRHLDDELGSGDLAALARNELALIVRLLRGGSYTDAVGRRLYALPPRRAVRLPGITSTRTTIRPPAGTSKPRCARPRPPATP